MNLLLVQPDRNLSMYINNKSNDNEYKNNIVWSKNIWVSSQLGLVLLVNCSQRWNNQAHIAGIQNVVLISNIAP